MATNPTAPAAPEIEAEAQPDASDAEASQSPRQCTVCDVKLSSYNPGPNCWSHTIGYPWRGPTAKPKYE